MVKAINSVIGQQYESWELIVVDDGSTDNTAQVVRAIDDERIRYVYQTNQERCAARNNGIDHATGKYICFLDSDDYYFPERLALLYQELERRSFPCQMFYTGLVIDMDNHTARNEINETQAANIFDHIATNIIHSQQVCICSPILQQYKFDTRFRIAEDTELWLRIAQKYPVSYLKGQFTVALLHHDDRSVNLTRYNSGAGQLEIHRHILSGSHSGKRISAEVQLYMLADSYHAIARYHVHQHNRFTAAMAMLRALYTNIKSPWSKFRLHVFLKLVSFSGMEKVKKLIDS